MALFSINTSPDGRSDDYRFKGKFRKELLGHEDVTVAERIQHDGLVMHTGECKLHVQQSFCELDGMNLFTVSSVLPLR